MSQIYSYTCTLSKELQEIAKTELNEKPERRDQDIQALRDRVVANKALKCPRDSAFLLRFLRARKFDEERAYQLLINYYTVRANNNEHLKALTPNNSKQEVDSGITSFIPSTDKEGRRIIFFRFGKWKPEEMEMIKLLRLNLMTLELLIREEANQVIGVVAVADMSEVGMQHVKNFDLSYIRTMSTIIQDGFPIRFKAMHYINEPSVFGYMFALVKPFMKEKMQNRQNFHGSSLESLHNFFDTSSLPSELGGCLEMGDGLAEEWKKVLYSNQKYFEDISVYKIDLEADLFRGSKTSSDVSASNVAGTFKKLEI